MKKAVLFLLFLIIMPSLIFAQTDALKLAAEYGGSFFYEPASGTCIFSLGLNEVRMLIGGNFVLFNFSKLVSGYPPIEYKNGSFIAPAQTAQAILEFFEGFADESRLRVGAVVIDPGHGGKDPGAYRKTIDGVEINIYEKDINLKIGKNLYAKLIREYPDKKIIMTRDSDVYPELEERSRIANEIDLPENEAVIFISIHADGAVSSIPYGFSVHYFPAENDRDFLTSEHVDKNQHEILPLLNDMYDQEMHMESYQLAKRIIDELEKKVGDVSQTRGLKEDNFSVVRRSLMPAVLIETGFVSNLEEAKRLKNDNYLMKLADAIYNGIDLFIDDFEKSNGFMGVTSE